MLCNLSTITVCQQAEAKTTIDRIFVSYGNFAKAIIAVLNEPNISPSENHEQDSLAYDVITWSTFEIQMTLGHAPKIDLCFWLYLLLFS